MNASPNDFIKLFCNELEIESPEQIDLNTELQSLPEWDSLGMVRFLLACNENFDVEFAATAARDAKTVGDLYQLG